MRSLAIILGAILLSIGPANADDAKTVCATAALNDYIKASLTFNSMTIESYVAKRRLEEQYCLRFAQCIIGSLPGQMPLVAMFSKCLKEEAMEKYNAVSKDD